MKTLPKYWRPGSLMLIAACLAVSGMLRLTYTGAALAKEISALSTTGPAAEDDAESFSTCAAEQTPSALLAAIRERTTTLQQQELQLADRRQTLAVVEKKVAEQILAMNEAETKLAATLAIADEATEKDLARLTAVYENMKPKNAADIFAGMDIRFAAGFLARMRPDAAANILAGLPTDKAYAISLTIAGRNADAPTE